MQGFPPSPRTASARTLSGNDSGGPPLPAASGVDPCALPGPGLGSESGGESSGLPAPPRANHLDPRLTSYRPRVFKPPLRMRLGTWTGDTRLGSRGAERSVRDHPRDTNLGAALPTCEHASMWRDSLAHVGRLGPSGLRKASIWGWG